MINKKIASATIVKNECDIIEEFVRYNCNFIDEMYIIDNMSTDSTLEILLKLREEGLPINLFRYNSYRFDQGHNLTKLQNLIREEHNIDYIIFMDADEFISAKSKNEFISILSEEEHLYYRVGMIKYTQHEQDELKQLPFHKKFSYSYDKIQNYKSIININLLRDKKIIVSEGSHQVFDSNNNPLEFKNIHQFHLAHFEQRSDEQMKSKYILGTLSYILRDPNLKDGVMGAHWFNVYNHVIDTNDIKSIHVYSVSELDINNNICTFQPLPLSCEIRYSNETKVDALENGINFFKGYIKYNNDEKNRDDLLTFLNNIDKNDKDTSLIKVAKNLEKYIVEVNKNIGYGSLIKI